MVLVGLNPQKDVAKKHRVSPNVVCTIVNKAKKNPNFIEALHEEDLVKGLRRQQARVIVRDMIAADTFIDNASQV